MISPVMSDAYLRIYYWYSTNGEFDLGKEEIVENIQDIKNFDKNSNLTNEHSIIYFYKKFCGSLNNININNPNLFIIMELPKSIKGFTFCYLKIVINSEGISFPNFQNQDIDASNKLILLKAYFIFLIIHFMERYFNTKYSNNV